MAGLRAQDLDPTTGRPMYEVCTDCNYDLHRCHGCGAGLLHGEDCEPCLTELRESGWLN